MPKGPRGEKRSADVIGNAVRVMRIATGEDLQTLLRPLPSERMQAHEIGPASGTTMRG
jgi:hypothetical protein